MKYTVRWAAGAVPVTLLWVEGNSAGGVRRMVEEAVLWLLSTTGNGPSPAPGSTVVSPMKRKRAGLHRLA